MGRVDLVGKIPTISTRPTLPAIPPTYAAHATHATYNVIVPEPDPRIFFAAERTLLAWMRTALALMGLGFVMARFDVLAGEPSSLIAGTGLIAISVAFIVAETRLYVVTVRRLQRGEPFKGHTSPLVLALAGVLVLLGTLLVAHLLL